MGIALAGLALLAAVAAFWLVSAIGDNVRVPGVGSAQVSQSSG